MKLQKIEKDSWYVCIKDIYNSKGEIEFQSGKVYHAPKDNYLIRDDNGQPEIIGAFLIEHFKLWSVKDAKPGDFLTYSSDEHKDWYFIYHSEYKPYDSHHHYFAGYSDEFLPGGTACIDEDYLRPSTPKEQNLLLQKIEEAGYHWDAENRKLIKTTEEVTEESTAPMTGIGKRMKVITLCGSTRFKEQFLEQQKRLTLEGNVVISVGLFGHSGDEEVWKPGMKEMLDKMHFQKIDMADEIFVINVGGYIGESTKREIAYAESKGKVVNYLDE